MHLSTLVVVSVQCQFCLAVGREEKVSAKRNTKFFKAPFRVEYYRQHHKGQHPSRWEEYSSLDKEKQLNYFNMHKLPVKETVRALFWWFAGAHHC